MTNNATRSLVEHFTPPGDLRGFAGWICGYSADQIALNSIAERFTGEGRRERARAGLPTLGLILESTHEQIPPTAVPGLLHLLSRSGQPPFRLMHAKVALLGFRDLKDPQRWSLRLIVSTGNWTRQTSQDSLDLVWRIDLDRSDLDSDEADVSARRADFAAAYDFMTWLRGYYQSDILTGSDAAGTASLTAERFRTLDRWLELVGADGTLPPARFFDTRSASIIEQLPGLVDNETRGGRRRNVLVVGSGFYEGPSADGSAPQVPFRVRSALRSAGFLTADSASYLILEPSNCQMIAVEGVASKLTEKRDWILLGPGQPHWGLQLRLHAKFLFSAYERTDSDKCGSAWAYVGSGNMTEAGFLRAASRSGGNLEAGVVFAPDGLRWSGNQDELNAVTTLLPIDWDLTIDDGVVLSTGDPRPEDGLPVLAAPVSHLVWNGSGTAGRLHTPEALGDQENAVRHPFEVVDLDGVACPLEAGAFVWPHPQPSQVHVRFEAENAVRVVTVPVQDDFGRMAGQSLEPIEFDMAIDKLSAFPFPPADDPYPPPEKPDPNRSPTTDALADRKRSGVVPSGLAIRRSMHLVETIADRQVAISPEDWHSWCHRLHCVLCQIGANDPIFADLRAIGMNPLSVLRRDPFLPAHARQDGPTRDRPPSFLGWHAVSVVLNDRAAGSDDFLNRSQKSALKALADRLEQNSVVLADEVGMGKTRIAVAVADAVIQCGGRVAILIPPGLDQQWQEEIRKVGERRVRGALRSIESLLVELGSENPDECRIRDPYVLLSHNLASWKLDGSYVEWRREVLMNLIAQARHKDEQLPRLFKNEIAASWDGSIRAAGRMVDLARHQPAARVRLDEVLKRSTSFSNLRGTYASGTELRLLYDRAIGLSLGAFDLTIIDEAHKSRNPWNKLSVLIDTVLLNGDDARRLCMTATPVEIDSHQWRQTLKRAGLDFTGTGPWPRIEAAIEQFVAAVGQVRRRWRSDPESRSNYENAAREFQMALDPYLIRRDKRNDDDVLLFGVNSEHGTSYRVEIPIRIEPSALDADWKQAVFAVEALSLLREKVSGKEARARLTMGSGQGIASIFDEAGSSPDDELQKSADAEDVQAVDIEGQFSPHEPKTTDISRAEWWRSLMLAPLKTGHLYDHPAIKAAADAIERHTEAGEKVLVFGRYTEPMRALTRLLNARALLRAMQSEEPWPESGVREEMVRPLSAASRQIGIAFDEGRLEAFLAAGYRKFEARRESLRRSMYSRIRIGLGRREVDLSLLLQAAEDYEGGSSLLVSAMDEFLSTLATTAEELPDTDLANVFATLIGALREKAEGDEDGNGNLNQTEARKLWPELELRLKEEFGGQRATFARFIYGATSHSTRRLMQLAFNRQGSSPKVLIAQSLVGREGLNLHEACRVVVMLHLEWNPGVVEQQIGRVDRVNGHWNRQLKRYDEEIRTTGQATIQLPRIEMRPVIFEGTYDEHHWSVLSNRWDDLRAQLHGAIIPERDRADSDLEEKAIIAYLDGVSPNFDPLARERDVALFYGN
jgi:superfamily II DNA or RNA helicase